MRKLFLSCTFAVALAGCTAIGGGPLNLQDFIAQVQTTTSAVCSFLPTAETIAAIVATGNPIVTTAAAVADAICKSVTSIVVAPPPVAPGGSVKTAAGVRRAAPVTPTVAGVVIHGKFLR